MKKIVECMVRTREGESWMLVTELATERLSELASPWHPMEIRDQDTACRIRANREFEVERYVEFRDLEAGKISHAMKTDQSRLILSDTGRDQYQIRRDRM